MTVTNRMALAREQLVFVVKESVKGQLAEPASSNMVRVTNAPAFNQKPEYFEDQQFRDVRSKESRVRGRFLAGDWNLNTYIKPAGTCGVAPEVSNLLESTLGDMHDRAADVVIANGVKHDVIVNAGNSTTKAYFADASTFKVGMRIKIVQTTPAATTYKSVASVNTTGDNFITWTGALAEAVDEETDIIQADNTTTTCLVADASNYLVGDGLRINNQTTFITEIKSDTFDRLTFAPALTAASVENDVIKAGVHFTLANDPKSMSIWHSVGHTMFVIVGASCDKLKLTVHGKEVGKLEFSGKFMKMIKTGTDEVGASGIGGNVGDTTLTVLDGRKYSADSVIRLEDEVMKVSAVVGNDLTVVRGYQGTSRVAHLAGVAVTPWAPTGYGDIGTPQHGRMGFFRVDGANVTILGADVELDNGIKYYEEEKTGTDFAEDFDAVEQRGVKASVELFLRTNDIKYFDHAVNQTQSIVELPCGDVDGLICIARMPKCEWSQPGLSADKEMKATIELAALASTTGNDELSIHFL